MKSTERFRAFTGIWIKKSVWFSKLTIMEKCLLAEIESLSQSKDGCFATNEYMAAFFGVSEAHIKRMISNLKKLELVKAGKFNGRYRFLILDHAKMDALPEREVGIPVSGRGSMDATPGVASETQKPPLTPLNTNELGTPISKGITKNINKNTDVPIKSNPESEKEKTQPPSSAAPLPIDDMNNKGWNKAVFSIWKEKCGGELPIHQLKAMKKLVDMFGWRKVEPAFKAYLAETEAMYVSVHSFASRFGIWESKVPKTVQAFGPR